MESGPSSGTLLSTVHALTTSDLFPSSSIQELHPFAESHDEHRAILPQLQNIQSTASLISLALSSHSSLNITDSKLVSLMRQHAVLTQELNTAESQLASRLRTLRERHGVDYGDDLPSSKATLVSWFLAQIESWGTASGLQVFSEPETGGKLGVVLAGKILVLDIEFHVNGTEDDIEIELITLKSSHASPLDAPATSASSLPTSGTSLDTFLATTFREFLGEVQKRQPDVDPIHVTKLGRALRDHLQYIMKLDQLAQREVEGGSRWFTEVDDLGSVANQVIPKEVEAVAKELGLPHAPLDVLLLRGHALPLPYLQTPSLSFLVYLSPLSYLTLLRTSSTSDAVSAMTDIPMPALRSYLSGNQQAKGNIVATLYLGSSSQPSHFVQTHGRPTFPLVPLEPSDDTDFLTLDHILPVDNGPHAWLLDFGPDGVVVSQGRMWEIQLLLGLAPGLDTMQMMSFGYTGSWVDLLVQKPEDMPHERYTATYTSPTTAHPPLYLRLTVPAEPGFILRKIRVQSMRDIWSICEIVKEQSWYNNLITSCHWSPEGSEVLFDTNDEENSDRTENIEDILNGARDPKRIPVNMYLEAPIPPSFPPGLFEPEFHRIHTARLVMVFPSRTPGASLINASITFDPLAKKSIRVDVNGAPVSHPWEEIVRRGGGMGLAGRLWLKSGEAPS